MRFTVPLIAGVLLIIASLVVVFLSTGELRTFGWLLFGIGVLFTAANVMMRSRLR